ncbi:MAG: DNA replication and repair protein RecF [Chloroflexota bacterium]|nr:DNA replication and repair protein RecF [Chloroflexota bacterium]MDE2920586.1 DNA replication and repair protein RecF [Chloroflexota bacterium]
MRVAQLQLANFRNYRRLTLDLPPGPSVIVGGNGQGKTNLLDALHILASAQSLRPGPEAAWVRFGAPSAEGFARLRAQVDSESGPSEVEMVVARTRPQDGEASGVRRRARVDDVVTRLADLAGRLLAVSFAPSDLNLWTGSPSGRRRWLDLAVAQVDPTYTAHLTTYEGLLSRRNALLRRLQGGLGRPRELEFWDDRISEPAVEVTRARAGYVARVRAPVSAGFLAMQGGARLDLAYRATGLGLDAQGFRVALQQRRNRDVQRGASGLGPHRDDLEARLDGRPLAHVGSRGQLRLAALALKLGQHDVAHEQRTERPVLLLDDIAAELDPAHRRLLIDQLPGDAQALVTTADPALLNETELRHAAHYRVVAGEVERIHG